MRITLTDTSCLVEQEPGDKRHYGIRNAAGESSLLYAIKNRLNDEGYDFIKKRMAKDGHMVDDMQQYLRERKPVNGRQLAIYNGGWAIEGADETLNRMGQVRLIVQDIGTEESMSVTGRLDYLRGEIEAERISMGEIVELQNLAADGLIPDHDLVLLQWANVPEDGEERAAASRNVGSDV